MRKLLPLLVVCFSTAFSATSQTCPDGYASASLNWEALDYIPTTGYSNTEATAMSPNQFFAFGKNRLNINYTTVAPNAITSVGENNSHTGDVGSYTIGDLGDDVQYKGNGTITLTFAEEVSNVKFSLYDIDLTQKVQVSAVNTAGVPQNVNITVLGSSSILSVTNNGGTSPVVGDYTFVTSKSGTVTYGTIVDQDVNTASCNIDIAGPVKTITLTISSAITGSSQGSTENGLYWLSDIQACTPGAFPTDYYKVSQPFNGMPGYVLVAANKAVYMVDPATGKAKFIFTDASTTADGTINSLAYDPYNKIIYYTWSLTNNGTANASERTLRKYDMNTRTSTVLLQDIRSLGIPTFDQGVESGAGAFYDGAYYIGIEGGAEKIGNNPKTATYKESIVWRIDFNSSGVPTSATQVFGTSGDTHDWGDFAIVNGMLYDFNGEDGGAHYFHYALQTGSLVRKDYILHAPRQAAVGWDSKVYWVGTQIAQYNLNGGVGTRYDITSNPIIPDYKLTGSPSFGDAAEAFRPAVDFGDAPIAYDPDPDAPALHETVDNLRLGGTTDVEWTKPVPGLDADADGIDEDAIPYAPAMMNNGTYQVNVSVLNNTTGNATLIGWLDIDGDNIFEPTEAISAVVLPQSSTQSVSLYWPSTVTSLPNNSYTYLRLRLTSAANNMTTSTPSGYFADGEVEDWRVMVNVTPLAVKLADFGVRKTEQGQVDIRWTVTGEEAHTRYELQKSADGQHWTGIYQASASASRATAAYQYVDAAPYQGDTYYRLKITEANEGVQYSAVGKVVFDRTLDVHFTPNPAAGSARMAVQSEGASRASIRLLDMSSRTVYEKAFTVAAGMNQLTVPLEGLAPGVYQAEVLVGNRRYTQKLVVRK